MLDRSLFALTKNDPHYSPGRAELVTRTTLTDFRGAVEDILAQCGIERPA